MLTDTLLTAARKAAPELARMGEEINRTEPGAKRLALARRFFSRVSAEAPRLQALVVSDMLSSDAAIAFKAHLCSAALISAPNDHSVALAMLDGIEHLHPQTKVSATERSALTALLETANETGRGDLTRTLAITLRGYIEPPEGSAAAVAMRDARLANMQTRIGLWRAGRLLSMLGADGPAAHARNLYNERYPYHRDHRPAAEVEGRVLVLNARPWLKADTIPGVHNHSNLPHSLMALQRRPSPAIDVLLLHELDFDDVKHRIAPPDVILNNIGGAEALEASGHSDLIQRIAAYFEAPLINHPEKVKATTRLETARRIGDRGLILHPETHRLAPSLTLSEAIKRLEALFGDAEIILRSTTAHMGADMHRITNREEIPAALKALGFSDDSGERGEAVEAAYAIAFHDFRSSDGLWRKYRIYRFDDDLAGLHIMTADGWNVHRKAMRALDARDPSLRLEEKSAAFGETMRKDVPAPVLDAIEAAMAETGLDAVGVDFALLPDGRALVFEMNAAMRIDAQERVALSRFADMLDQRIARHRAQR